jgi:flagellum-specific peptidoglycan hydrolase FlgJ
MSTIDGQNAAGGIRPTGSVQVLQVTGRAGVPSGVSSAVLNVTVDAPQLAGFITVYPCGAPIPTASNLNYVAGQTVPNAVISKLSAAGTVCLFASAATHLVVDVTGYFATTNVVVPLGAPARLLETRGGLTTVDAQFNNTGLRPDQGTIQLTVNGRAGIPANASAVVLNVTVDQARGGGFLTVYPTGEGRPLSSNLNYVAGQTVPNAVIARLGAGGTLCIYTQAATHLIVDVAGYITGTAPTAAGPTCPADPTPPPSQHFVTLPPGSALPSGAQCATQVRAAAEIRADNTAANNNRGSRAVANTNNAWSGFNRVDGDFAGTTDEIIQWAACKWGIDEDIVRAQAIKESYWHQSNIGDNGESFGITQVRITAHASAFQYPTVNARNSTAYNLDYTYASWRACYEGVYTWLNTVEHNGTYAAGDVWGCVGLWFSGRWYVNTDAYLNQTGDSVHWHYTNKTWLTSAFING